MAFQIKDFTSIVAAIINHARGTTRKITDFQEGSVARTLMEAPAVEIEELYLQMFLGLREAIPVAVFQSFGFDQLPASYATGYVSVSGPSPNEPLIVPVGIIFTARDGRTYTSTSAVTWNADSTLITVPVISATLGSSGNIADGLIASSSFFGPDYTIGNQAINSGNDKETSAEREARFAEFVSALSRGTVAACLYAARQALVTDGSGNVREYVTRSGIHETAGYVRIYLYSSAGIPSDALLLNAQQLIDGFADPDTGEPLVVGFRSAGVRVDAIAMRERTIPMGIGVRMRSGTTLTDAIRQQIFDAFSLAVRAVQPNEILLIDNLRAVLLSAPGVLEMTLSTTENITCRVNEALVPGDLALYAL